MSTFSDRLELAALVLLILAIGGELLIVALAVILLSALLAG